MEFNEKSGIDVYKAIKSFGEDNGFSVKVLVSTIWAGIRGEEIFQNKPETSFAEVGALCQTHGFQNCSMMAIQYLTKAVGSDEALKKIEAEKENPQK